MLYLRQVGIQHWHLGSDARPGEIGCVGLDTKKMRHVAMRYRHLAGQPRLADFKSVHFSLVPVHEGQKDIAHAALRPLVHIVVHALYEVLKKCHKLSKVEYVLIDPLRCTYKVLKMCSNGWRSALNLLMV